MFVQLGLSFRLQDFTVGDFGIFQSEGSGVKVSLGGWKFRSDLLYYDWIGSEDVKKFRLLTWTLTSAAVRFSSYEVRRVPKILGLLGARKCLMRWALPESMLMDLHFVDGILDHFSTVCLVELMLTLGLLALATKTSPKRRGETNMYDNISHHWPARYVNSASHLFCILIHRA